MLLKSLEFSVPSSRVLAKKSVSINQSSSNKNIAKANVGFLELLQFISLVFDINFLILIKLRNIFSLI